MPNFEYNFNDNDYSLIASEGETTFGSGDQDYIRLTIFNSAGNIVTLGDNTKAIFYSSPTTQSLVIQTPSSPDELQDITIGTTNDFVIFKDAANFYIKPNEILSSSLIPEGNYTLQSDFLNQFKDPDGDRFIIKQISPSRKEVRLKLLDTNITSDSMVISDFRSILGDIDSDGYSFKHVLYVGDGLNIPIVNYAFDSVTDGEENQSIILKLYEPLPTNIPTTRIVTLEKEILITQTEEVFYFSDIPPAFPGGSLNPDSFFDYWGLTDSDENFESLDDLSGSLSTETLKSIFSGSSYDYPNLNTDFTKFSNHTFFGSAKEKLHNFERKVRIIQQHYSNISSSLSANGNYFTGSTDYLIQHRQDLFGKIQNEIDNFTPYERFLYHDGQTQNTASAPGIGLNYADTVPVAQHAAANDNGNESITLNNHDGFDIVYKHSDDGIDDSYVDLFTDKYYAHQKPFFNHSGSVYLSFLFKGNNITPGIHWQNSNQSPSSNGFGQLLPNDAFSYADILKPNITGSEYRRFVHVASQSYWVPVTANNDTAEISDWGAASSEYQILTGSLKIKEETPYKQIRTDGVYSDLATVVTQSGVPFSGSIMPAGELFRMFYDVSAATASSFITDVKVSLKNPTNVLPFDILYHTGSSEWTDWYDDIYDSATTFDTDNIHSLENNLPLYIKQSSDYNDFKRFLSLIGEHFDLIRNHIDNLGTLHNRNYNKTDSVPSNLIPILLDNMGWEAINPFTSSLAGYFGQSLSSVTSVKDLSENTWRKSLNNLIYLYKSKGTKNSIRSLLNIYGYPPDVLQINEFGSSTQPQNDYPISSNIPQVGITTNDTSLRDAVGNISFDERSARLSHYRFNNDSQRILNLDWWMNDAKPSSIEFIYKHLRTPNTQEILMSSGSGTTPSTATITILSSSADNLDGDTVIISSSDGTAKTYIFDNDDEGVTGTTDGSGRVRVQISGSLNVGEFITELSKSIASSNGHNGKIKITDEQYLSASNGAFYTNTNQSFALANSGKLNLTQTINGVEGNNTITSSVSGSYLTTTGFSGGNDSQTLWDLRLLSSNDSISSSFEFRLNNTENASGSITSNAISMSTSYVNMHDGQLWNVMLQRMSSSISGSGINKYRLFTALQKKNIISKMNFVSMSVEGGTTRDANYNANENWQSSGSRNYLSSSNLYVGRTLSGSLAEIRTWTVPLSTSKYRLHTLNKFSTIGNTISSHRNDLIYHFKLNENHTSASIDSGSTTIDIKDSNPNNIKDFGFTKSSDIVTGSLLYGFDNIFIYTIGLQDASENIENSRQVIINPNISFTGNNLNPFYSSVINSNDISTRRGRRTSSTKLEIGPSPQDYINKFILDKIQGFNLEILYGNPRDEYKPNYQEMDDFRKTFFDTYDISVNINKFIRGHENMFNQSLIDSIKKLVPVRSTLSDRRASVGVTIKPTILEKQKYEKEKNSIEVNPNTVSDIIEVTPLITEAYEAPKNINISATDDITLSESEYLPSKNGSLSINNSITETATYEAPKDIKISINNSITETATYEKSKDTEIPIDEVVVETATYEKSKDTEIPIDEVVVETATYKKSKDVDISIEDSIDKQMSHKLSKDSEIGIVKDIIKKGNTTFTFPDKSASLTFKFKTAAVDKSSISLISLNGKTRKYQPIVTGSITGWDGNGTPSGSYASASITFTSTPPISASITLTSTDGTEKTYKSHGTGSNSVINGTLSADGATVLFATGSNGTTVAENLAAAVTSSNGHSTKFNVSQTLGAVTLTQTRGGPNGNKVIYAPTPLLGYGISGSSDNSITGSILTLSSSFDGALNDNTFILFDTGSGSETEQAENFLAAVTSSDGHESEFIVSRNISEVKLTQTQGGSEGNTKITTTGNFTNSTTPPRYAKVRFSFTDKPPISSSIALTSTDGTEKIYKAQEEVTGSTVNGTLSADSGSVLFSTGSNGTTAAGNFLAAITSSLSHGHGSKLTVFRTGNSVIISQSVAGTDGNTLVTFSDSITGSITGTEPLGFQGGEDFPTLFTGGSEKSKTFDETKSRVIKQEMSHQTSEDSTIDINEVVIETMTYITPKNATTSLLPSVESSKQTFLTGSNTYFRDHYTATFRDLHSEWGRDSGSTHFISNHITGAYNDNNVRHIDPRYVFYSIGDVEVFSGSTTHYTDFTNQSRFYNRQQITEFVHSDMTYESYINAELANSGSSGPQVGRAMGKTRYFYTSSNGDITYPSNHVSRYPSTWKNRMYEGTQNTNPGHQQLVGSEYEDLSTASFYSVTLTGGENEIRVVSGKRGDKGKDGKIIY